MHKEPKQEVKAGKTAEIPKYTVSEDRIVTRVPKGVITETPQKAEYATNATKVDIETVKK